MTKADIENKVIHYVIPYCYAMPFNDYQGRIEAVTLDKHNSRVNWSCQARQGDVDKDQCFRYLQNNIVRLLDSLNLRVESL